jgi:hypothetical protein
MGKKKKGEKKEKSVMEASVSLQPLVAKTPPSTSLPCSRYWTSLRHECKKCKDKMKCPMYLAHWKKHQKLMRR